MLGWVLCNAYWAFRSAMEKKIVGNWIIKMLLWGYRKFTNSLIRVNQYFFMEFNFSESYANFYYQSSALIFYLFWSWIKKSWKAIKTTFSAIKVIYSSDSKINLRNDFHGIFYCISTSSNFLDTLQARLSSERWSDTKLMRNFASCTKIQ